MGRGLPVTGAGRDFSLLGGVLNASWLSAMLCMADDPTLSGPDCRCPICSQQQSTIPFLNPRGHWDHSFPA